MNKTNDKGINYTAGQSVNFDTDTGIRYGVIPTNDCNGDVISDLFQNGTDLDHAHFMDEVKKSLRGALSDYFDDYKWAYEKISKLDNAVDNAFEAISDSINDDYQGSGDCVRMEYEREGYKLLTDSSGDLWVIKSPYFTYAQFCSPCAPGACHLRNPLESPDDGNKCYCLGSDWFDDNKAPYPVYSVETGKEIA